MIIRIKETGVLVSEQEFRNNYPNISFPQQLTENIINEFGADIVFEGTQIVPSAPYEYTMYSGVEEINGKWHKKYILGPVFIDTEDKTAEQQLASYKTNLDNQQASTVRHDRDNLLKQSDWTQTLDAATRCDQSSWASYRQELADITKQQGFPWNVIWPSKPTEGAT
jgi:hypothetical protein